MEQRKVDCKRVALCRNCPWKRESPKAGEPGGSVPVERDPRKLAQLVDRMTSGLQVMQCHASTDESPAACAGFLSVVGYESVGVRYAVSTGVLDDSDVGRPIAGLYGSVREMLREANQQELQELSPEDRLAWVEQITRR